jgi:phosphate transport system permease protein
LRLPNLGDVVFRSVCRLAAALVIVVAALLVFILLENSWDAITTIGWHFFVATDWEPNHAIFGALAFVYGTILTSALAMLLAVPLGVGTAAYLSEVATGPVRRVVSFLVEMLAAIPSVVYGFWGIFVLAPALEPLVARMTGVNTAGKGILAASIVIAIMIIPYVTAVSYDVCRAVPRSQREAALALGATRWQMIWTAVLPFARPGITGACFLALGRALGETMAATMLIGNKAVIDWSIFAQGNTIASVIANEFNGADSELWRSALTELALVLLLVTVGVNALARLMIWRVGHAGRAKSFQAPPPVLESTNHLPPSDRPRIPRAAPAATPFRANNPLLRRIDRIMTWVLRGCVVLTVGPLFFILTYLVIRGVGSLSWDFFVKTPPPLGEPGGGMANALVGSAMLVGLATAFAVPVGLFAAIFLAEYRNGWLANSTRFIGELLGGVPSIVIGIFVYSLIVRPTVGWLGYSCYAGSFALGVMMIPIVMRAAEESLKLVPQPLRHASYALGSTQWQTVVRIIVPAALPAIITGVFLAIARIGGETAPLLMTAGDNRFFPTSPADQTPSIPVFIYRYATGPYESQHEKAWAAALVLLVVVMALNFGIRFLTGKRVVLASRAD